MKANGDLDLGDKIFFVALGILAVVAAIGLVASVLFFSGHN